MMLEDGHIYYPEHLPAADVVRRIAKVLAQSDERAVWLDDRLDLPNFIQRCAWNYGVHPIWVLVSLQREQSLVADNGKAADARAWSRALGVVGQHTPGQANSLWDGLPNQIMLCCRSTAWLAGIGARELFGYRAGLWPTAIRWTEEDTVKCAKNISLLNLDGSFHKTYTCKSVAEYVQYGYTPKESVLAENAAILDRYIIKPFSA